MKTFETKYETLYKIYDKHRRRNRENSYDSQQMCLMWPTDDPPDDIEGTEPFCDIEEAFGICIDDDDALDLYNMNLDEAAKRIIEMLIS
ncbi:MAG: hypothetical protein JXD22_08615 [Sedimentisphaerales bacterium]|nr:hypothetical protein [Sedimentisphaerales bacterium]